MASNETFSSAVARAMKGIQVRPREEPDEMAAAAAFLLAAKKQVPSPEPEPAPVITAAEIAQVIDKHKCSFCHETVHGDHDRLIRASCNHVVHMHCFIQLARAGRQYCAACPPPATYDADAQRNGGYTVDAGNDADVRAAMIAALEYRREKARTHAFSGETEALTLTCRLCAQNIRPAPIP